MCERAVSDKLEALYFKNFLAGTNFLALALLHVHIVFYPQNKMSPIRLCLF